MTKPVKTIITRDLANLGLSVNFGPDGRYHCIDTDGIELKSFDLKYEALAYLRETFTPEIEAQHVEIE